VTEHDMLQAVVDAATQVTEHLTWQAVAMATQVTECNSWQHR